MHHSGAQNRWGVGWFWLVRPPLEIMVPLEKVLFLPFKVLQEDPLLPDSQPCSDVVEHKMMVS